MLPSPPKLPNSFYHFKFVSDSDTGTYNVTFMGCCNSRKFCSGGVNALVLSAALMINYLIVFYFCRTFWRTFCAPPSPYPLIPWKHPENRKLCAHLECLRQCGWNYQLTWYFILSPLIVKLTTRARVSLISRLHETLPSRWSPASSRKWYEKLLISKLVNLLLK